MCLQEAGLGGGCEIAYHAIIEAGEIIRLANKYQPYKPSIAAEVFEELFEDSVINQNVNDIGGWN